MKCNHNLTYFEICGCIVLKRCNDCGKIIHMKIDLDELEVKKIDSKMV